MSARDPADALRGCLRYNRNVKENSTAPDNDLGTGCYEHTN